MAKKKRPAIKRQQGSQTEVQSKVSSSNPSARPAGRRRRTRDEDAGLETTQYGAIHTAIGTGGETRQQAGKVASLTTQQGVVVSDDQNTLSIGARGPQLLEDFVMREKIFHFDHERIPERVVHARGFGAKGYFEAYNALPDLTMAAPFRKRGQRTDVFVRFSTVAGNKGSADLARDVRGFAVKFYTDEGNWDLVGNNIPVFFIQDAMKFPDLIHAAKAEPDRGWPQAQTAHDNFWDFISLMPESINMALWIMSDRTIPRSFRFMEGFGVHTFRLVNQAGESTFVKFHWKPKYGLQSVTWDEAVKINGADPDFHRRDLWQAIEKGDFPEWELCFQTFDDTFADEFEFDVLDATKMIPEEVLPLTPVGKMVLDQNVDNFFAETEQVAFCTQNVVPGIDFTNDPLLQGRNFSYLDTQLKRLGSPNFTRLPVNAPRCPFAHFQQDGHMAMVNPTGRANYEPNSWGDQGGPREDASRGYRSLTLNESGRKVRERSSTFADHYSQANQFYRSQSAVEQQHITDAFVFELSKVETPAIRERMVGHLRNVDEALAEGVAEGLGLVKLPDAPAAAIKPNRDLATSPALSILQNAPKDFAGRVVGALVADGSDSAMIDALRHALEAEGARLKLIAPHIQGIKDSAGKTLSIDETVEGGPSVLFDAIALIVTEAAAASLKSKAAARQFLSDAQAHKKFIAWVDTADALIRTALPTGTEKDDGWFELTGAKQNAVKFVETCRALRYWDRG
jgi:catalase